VSDGGGKDFVVEGIVTEKTCLVMKEELSFFPFLEKDELLEMPCYFQPKEYAKGDIICEEGGPCDFVGFIVSGRCEIKKQTEFKGKTFILGIYAEGSMVGELCICDDHPRAYSAVALEDTTLITISRNNFAKMLVERPDLGAKFLKGLLLSTSIRLRKSFDRMASIF
jgi:CRP/FNR family cyclic AMP-dependent transcriptional regulator